MKTHYITPETQQLAQTKSLNTPFPPVVRVKARCGAMVNLSDHTLNPAESNCESCSRLARKDEVWEYYDFNPMLPPDAYKVNPASLEDNRKDTEFLVFAHDGGYLGACETVQEVREIMEGDMADDVLEDEKEYEVYEVEKAVNVRMERVQKLETDVNLEEIL